MIELYRANHHIKIKQLLLLVLTALLISGCATHIPPNLSPEEREAQPEPGKYDYASYADLLDEHVNDSGLVDYPAILKDQTKLDEVYTQIATFSPDSHPALFPTEDDKLAYWLNAYNATVIKAVINYYPLSSVHDVEGPFFLPQGSGFFFLQQLTYGGATTSLYYLENSVIRGRFDEPRIHFALNCASLGCPQLPRVPFLPETLDADLERETRKFINDDSKVKLDTSNNTLFLSSIFKWYKSDFTHGTIKGQTDTPRTLVEYVMHYLEKMKRKELMNIKDEVKIEYLDYDWGLNEQK